MVIQRSFAPILWTTSAAFAALATAAVIASVRVTRKRKVTSEQIAWILRLSGGTILLQNVNIPVGVTSNSTAESDEEGFVACSILIRQGRITDINYDSASTKRAGNSTRYRFFTVDCGGAIVTTCFVDAHTHLVKTHVVPRLRNTSGTINEALEIELCDQPRWKIPGDVSRRMEFAIQSALHYGTKAMRTHLDGTASEDPQVVETVYQVFDELREKYANVMMIQGVANLFLPLWLDPTIAKPHAERAKRHNNVVLGAYVPPTFGGPKSETKVVAALDALFGYAQQLDMDVDMHIDETNEKKSCGLFSLCVSLEKARNQGYHGKVVLGHCCALSLQSRSVQQEICIKLAELNAYVVSNPFTNLGLQDRIGSKPPFGASIPTGIPRTPQWRGLTLLQELRHAGVNVASASDNVRDHWYPYGDYDMLSVWAQTQAMGHLETAPSEGSWADLITSAPARAMGIENQADKDASLLVPGQVADLVLFPSARRASELFARPQCDRIILRKGRVLSTRLPDFDTLDDLVSTRTVTE